MFKKIHIIRIKPDQELLQEILAYCEKKKITSAVILFLLGKIPKSFLIALRWV